jgi:hypothetical protein
MQAHDFKNRLQHDACLRSKKSEQWLHCSLLVKAQLA